MGLLRKLSKGLIGAHGGAPRGKEGARAYAIGDIHGRLDLLDRLLERIEADAAARPRRRNFIIFLGDLVDRGPDSAGVVERLRTYRPGFATPIFLAGNHEEVLLRLLAGDRDILASWLKFGGAECAQSYGLDPDAFRRLEEDAALQLLQAKVPRAHAEFLASFADTFRFGDYLFVHAGIRPGIAVEEQNRFDLRWIREPFLSDVKEHGVVVVHGHTIVGRVEERPNRIAIDTGAYHSGVLTALAVEDERRWYLATDRSDAARTPASLHDATA
jgi:diadenosine tetraphosphatase ApaH/serine/threonine PP2A family protein phosphatase